MLWLLVCAWLLLLVPVIHRHDSEVLFAIRATLEHDGAGKIGRAYAETDAVEGRVGNVKIYDDGIDREFLRQPSLSVRVTYGKLG